MKQNLRYRLKRMTGFMHIIYIIQLVLTTVAVIYYIGIHLRWIQQELPLAPSVLFGILFITLICNGYFVFKDIDIHKSLQMEADSKDEAILNIEKLNRNLRAQRHDFLNHIQVLYSLMELEEYEETRVYLNHLYGDIIKIGSRIKTECVSVNALLQAKSNECEKNGIRLDLMLKSRLADLPMGEWEICRILGNLIDNAMEALKESPKEEKVITVHIFETIKSIEIRIRNNGPFVPESLTHKIFEAGVSSKKDKEEHGMGLYIVRNLLHEKGHEITLEQEGDVCFHVTLKKMTVQSEN